MKMEDSNEICENAEQMEKQESPEEQQDMGAEGEGNVMEELQVLEQQESINAVDESQENSCSMQYPCYPAPPVEIKLFVGRLPRTLLEDDVRPIFAKFGDVIEVVIIRDRGTSAHKGSAFIRMACIAQADSAIRELNGQKVLDASLGAILVKYAAGEAEKIGLTPAAGEEGVDQGKLFVGSLPKTITDSEVKKIFEPFGTLDEVYVMRDSNGAGKGCAFVKYAYKEQALYASKELDGKRTLEGLSRPMEVRCAEGKGQKGEAGVGKTATKMMGGGFGMNMNPMCGGYFPNPYGGAGMGMMPPSNMPRMSSPWKEYFNAEGRPYYHNELTNVTQWDRPTDFAQINRIPTPGRTPTGETVTGPPGANLFVFHIPNEWTDSHLAAVFAPFGVILSATIAKGKAGRNKGYGFVSYDNPCSAANAVQNMNGYMTLNKRLKVTVKQGEMDAGSAAPAGGVVAANGSVPRGMNGTCNNATACGMQPTGMNMMNQCPAIPAAQYGYAGNRYTPY